MKKSNYLTSALLAFTAVMVVAGIMFVSTGCVLAKNSSPAELSLTKNQRPCPEVLADVDKYQAKYFEIVKRNNVLLNDGDDRALNRDRKQLKKLYKEVEGKILEPRYLNKLKEIDNRYAECTDMTTQGMNEFAEKYYKEIDDLLNEVYMDVKSKIWREDFEKLQLSEYRWLKAVNKYEEVFDSMGFGTIGTIIYYGYQTDMRRFRTLLLMLYL
ncbi:MAG: DUF1311 domain-containing protein [Cyanobacteria bacterium RUI128]|nr:DUF1311 domain-containing protein [Cyanobacteria bacterium RUI128]